MGNDYSRTVSVTTTASLLQSVEGLVSTVPYVSSPADGGFVKAIIKVVHGCSSAGEKPEAGTVKTSRSH